METTIICRGNLGILEQKMETIIIYWGNTGIMEKKMETTIYSLGIIGSGLACQGTMKGGHMRLFW